MAKTTQTKQTKLQELKKIKLLSLGKVAAVISFIIGILMAVLLVILRKIAINTPLANTGNLASLSQLNLRILLILPFYYALIGFIWGIVIALIYNLVAKYLGGVKLELK